MRAGGYGVPPRCVGSFWVSVLRSASRLALNAFLVSLFWVRMNASLVGVNGVVA